LPDVTGSIFYPNPVNQFISFNLEGDAEALIQIVDMNGVVVNEGFITKHSQKIDVSDLLSGLYLARIVQGKRVRSEKVLIQR